MRLHENRILKKYVEKPDSANTCCDYFDERATSLCLASWHEEKCIVGQLFYFVEGESF